ncbi:enoyl-CoA hydratase/isomerase family protein [Gordonia polyisoprenivorans]|uniref:enoyl-CoA hydratase/isomerase family protein n=1 Tax=Gordonia polyisoprenivorans TaxID=84595 RepID=UPI001AD621E0|nr:enoyl-CoA hydratase/isomerase family protein [Gordonia polyisoprenivorans]QTI69006.1 enoyl-CoA hydratase/isomerase family protein [Gordonia polyisoprenivorans]
MDFDEYADSFKTARLRRDDAGVLTVALHYRDGPLTWTAVAHREFPRLLTAIATDTANRVVILTGTGDAFVRTPEGYGEVYTSGRVKPSDWDRGLGEATAMLTALLDLPIPVVAAINGPVTGHAELALMCDVVLCTPNTYFQDLAHIPGNLVPGDGVQVLWPLVLGPVRAKHFLLTGQQIGAEQALGLGIVGEVVPEDALADRATDLATQLTRVDPLVMRHTRRLLQRDIRRALDRDLEMGLSLEAFVSVSRFPEFTSPPPTRSATTPTPKDPR